jgi:hypothetical protein
LFRTPQIGKLAAGYFLSTSHSRSHADFPLFLDSFRFSFWFSNGRICIWDLALGEASLQGVLEVDSERVQTGEIKSIKTWG